MNKTAIFLSIILLTAVDIASATTWYVDDSGGANYTKIQDAVDAASSGDMIIVKDGTYMENVDIGKSLTIKSENGAEKTIVQAANPDDHVFEVTADYVTINGFTVERGRTGIYLNGISMDYSVGNTIAGNVINDNEDGIYLKGYCRSNIIADNTVINNSNGAGIHLGQIYNSYDKSIENIIAGNVVNSNSVGIYLNGHSHHNIITDNTVNNNGIGISLGEWFKGSSGNIFVNNTVNNNGAGITLFYSGGNTIINNTFNNNGAGISLERGSGGNNITGNNVNYNGDGIYLFGGTINNNIITNNNVNYNGVGIRLRYLYYYPGGDVSNNIIMGNTANYNGIGIYLETESCCNTLISNTVNNNEYGIRLRHSWNNILTNNIANDNGYGIYLQYFSSNNVLRNNTMSRNQRNFGVVGSDQNLLEDYINDLDTSNTVDGRPIYYLVGASGTLIDSSSNAGTIYCISCDNIVIQNLTLEKNVYGVLFFNTNNSKIEGNHISNNLKGVYFYSSNSNTVYLNNFVNNDDSALSDSSTNTWNSPEEITYTYNSENYTSYLGNYWSDYSNVDANGDGIWDHPYTIDGDKDNYPLMEPFENYFTPTGPTCKIELQKNGVKIDRINIGEGFDIVITDYSGDIEQIRFLSDESQNGKVDEGFTWTDEYNCDESKDDWTGHWDAANKIKTWAFATPGIKEVWAEVKDNAGQTAKCSANIITKDVYWVAKAIASEAGSVWDVDHWVRCSDEERIAVGWTVLNRFDSGNFGSSIEDVVKNGYAYNQEPTQEIITLSNDLLKREISDSTGGATYFFSPISMPKEGEEYKCKPPIASGIMDCNGGLHQVPETAEKVYFPSWAKPKEGWIVSEFYQTVENLEWVSGLNNVSNWYFMFYRASNQPPLANIEPEVIVGISSGEIVAFDASKSNDSDGQIVSYTWDFGDGETATGREVTHRFRGAAIDPETHAPRTKTYTVTLVVKDDKGATDADTASVTVEPLEKSIEASGGIPPASATMTAYYNWIGVADDTGEDIYVISKIHFEAQGGYISCFLSIWDEYSFSIGIPAWSNGLVPFGQSGEKTFIHPFGTYRDQAYTFDDGSFEGMTVGPHDKMNLYAFRLIGSSGWMVPVWDGVSISFEPDSVEEHIIVEIPPDLTFLQLGSPGDLRVYDSQGRVTGLVDGTVMEEIPGSFYDQATKTVVILNSTEPYRYEVVGTGEGIYGLTVISIEDGETTTFNAIDIPTSPNAVHQYTIDWDILSQGGEGVTVKIDSGGDGVFEQVLTAGATFQMPSTNTTTSTTTPPTIPPDVPPVPEFPSSAAIMFVLLLVPTLAYLMTRIKR